MMRSRIVRGLWLVALALSMTVVSPGCLSSDPNTAEAVLAGTWKLTTETSTNLADLLLTFDDSGTLTRLTYKIGNVTIDATRLAAITEVNGNDVEISVTFGLNHFSFAGTLNDGLNIITGNTVMRIELGAVTITVDNGPATLTKQ